MSQIAAINEREPCSGSEEEVFYRLKEAARRLNVSVQTLHDWKRSGRIDLIRLGPRIYRVSSVEIDRFLSEARISDFSVVKMARPRPIRRTKYAELLQALLNTADTKDTVVKLGPLSKTVMDGVVAAVGVLIRREGCNLRCRRDSSGDVLMWVEKGKNAKEQPHVG